MAIDIEGFSEWVSAFRTLRKRYPSRDEIVNWVCQQGVEDGKANPDSPPCPRCGQRMVDRELGNKDEYQCRPCQFALSPLADMCLEGGLMLSWAITDRDYKEFPYFKELVQWLERVNADYPGPRLKQPSFMDEA